MTSSPLTRLLVAAAAVCALAPATANAASVGGENGSIVYRADDSGSSLLISSRQKDFSDLSSPMMISFSDSGASQITASAPCVATDDPRVALCPFTTTPIVVEGGASKDQMGIFASDSMPAGTPVTIRGNGGDDILKDAYNANEGRTFDGGPGNDKIEAYQGNDHLFGGDGNDELDGGEGDDELRGQGGSDKLYGDRYKDPGADILDGGDGVDTVEEWNIPDSDHTHPPATVTLDGQANDGRPGENDNVIAVETFNQYISLTFVGTDAAETVDMVNPNDELPSDLKGMGGNDVLKGWDMDDKVDGGAGDDRLEGGYGNDTITGGPGKDAIHGDKSAGESCWYSCHVPYGNDVIYAADGEADNITCGVGEDTVYADAADTVATDCEKVDKSGVVPNSNTNNGGPNSNGGPNNNGASDGFSLLGAATRKNLLAGKIGVSVPCAGACTVKVKATIGKKDAKKLRFKGTSLGSGSKTMLSAGTAKVSVKLSKKAKKALKKAKKGLKVTLSISTTGADDKTVTVKKTITLK